MRSRRPGPVPIDLPFDVQMAEIKFDPDTYSPLPAYKPAATRAQIVSTWITACSSGSGVAHEHAHATFVGNLSFAANALAAAGIRLLIEPTNSFDIPGFFLTRTQQALAIPDEVGSAKRAGLARLIRRVGTPCPPSSERQTSPVGNKLPTVRRMNSMTQTPSSSASSAIMGAHPWRATCSRLATRCFANTAGPVPSQLTAAGSTVCPTGRSVAERADIVFVMVPDTPDVEKVLFGEYSVASGLVRGKTVVDCSSIDLDLALQGAVRRASRYSHRERGTVDAIACAALGHGQADHSALVGAIENMTQHKVMPDT